MYINKLHNIFNTQSPQPRAPLGVSYVQVLFAGNTSNPMTNIVFDGVTITKPAHFPIKDGGYLCEFVTGWTRNSNPAPACLLPRL